MISTRILPSPSATAVLTQYRRYMHFHPLNEHPKDNSVSLFAVSAASIERLLFPEDPAAPVYDPILAPKYLRSPKQASGTSQASFPLSVY